MYLVCNTSSNCKRKVKLLPIISVMFIEILSMFCSMMIQEGVAVGRTFAALKDYQVDGNKEMMAIGIMNIVGSCTSCYITTGEKNEKKMINEYSSPIYAFHSMDM